MSGQPLDDAARLGALARSGLLDVTADPVLDRLTRLASRVVGAPVSLVSLVDAEGQHFTSQTGLPEPWSQRAGTPLSHSFCQHVVRTGERLVVLDALEDPRVRDNLAVPDLGVRAYAGFPLVDDDGNVLGSFCVLDDTPRSWTDEELETVADIAAAAASEIRARAALRVAAERVSLLAEASRSLHTDLDVGAAAEVLAARLVPVLGELCVIDLAGAAGVPGTSVVVAADPRVRALFLEAEARRPRMGVPESGVHRILRGGAAELVELDDEVLARVGGDAEQHGLYRELGLVEAVLVPVASRERVEGVLTLVRGPSSRPYQPADVALAEEIGRRIGVAVENARLYARQRDTAVTLQRSLLPRLEEPPGLAVAARYLPSGHAGQVGGDWYDLLTLPDGSVGVAVGDVAGHDVTAAAAMGQLRAVLRSYAWEEDSPGRVLDRVCTLVRALDESTMATVLYARLSPAAPDGSRRLVHASAGHPPAVLAPPGGGARLLEGVSPVIGIETDPRTETTTTLPVGSTLVCYSDGLVERRRENVGDGIERLRAAVERHAGDGVEELADALLAALLGGAPHEDDVALLVLRTL